MHRSCHGVDTLHTPYLWPFSAQHTAFYVRTDKFSWVQAGNAVHPLNITAVPNQSNAPCRLGCWVMACTLQLHAFAAVRVARGTTGVWRPKRVFRNKRGGGSGFWRIASAFRYNRESHCSTQFGLLPAGRARAGDAVMHQTCNTCPINFVDARRQNQHDCFPFA